jgi:hypothetical protein
MQNFDETKAENEKIIPSNETISIDGNVAMPSNLRMRIQLGRSMKEATFSWANLPLIGSISAGTIPSMGLNKPEMDEISNLSYVIVKHDAIVSLNREKYQLSHL